MQGSKPWYLITLISALCAALIVLLWRYEVTVYRPSPEQLTSGSDVKRSLEHSNATPGRLLIPTGLFILTFEFVTASEASVTGYIWQRHRLDRLAADDDKDTQGKTRAGIVFPEQVKASSTQLIEQYRREQVNEAGEHELVIGWYFDVTVRQHFDYRKYPLDRHDLWLRLWPKDFDKDVVLVPDLGSYDRTGRADRFGFDRDIVPGDWNIEDTFFSYERKCYDTRFGIQAYRGQKNFPELHFNITLTRRFQNAFIVALVPLISVLVLLFSILVMATSDRDKAGILGFNASGAIGASSALLFVVMLAHVSLRREFATAGLVYLEYFYLVSYAAMLGVSVNIYLFSAGHRGRLLDRLHRDDNLIPKLAFWPLVLVSLAIITGAVFGPTVWSKRVGSDDAFQPDFSCPRHAGRQTARDGSEAPDKT
jgi:hypothetical protein